METTSTRIKGIYQRGDSLIIDRIIKGERIYINLGKVSIKFAESVLHKEETAILEGRFFPAAGSRNTTVEQVLAAWWTDHLCHKKYGKGAQCLLDSIADRLGKKVAVKLTKNDIAAYVRDRATDHKKVYYKEDGAWKQRKGKPISRRTIQAELQQLTMAINHAVDIGAMPGNPITRFCKVDQPRPKKKMLDNGMANGPEWQAIYEHAGRSKLLFLLLYETGMRPAEAYAMRWSWLKPISKDHYIITIPSSEEKTETERDVPVSPTLLPELLKVQPEDGAALVFPGKDGQERVGLKTAWKLTIKRAKMTESGYTPYCLRRTRATIWDEVDPVACHFALGHVIRGAHYENYVRPTLPRLFKLVGIEFDQAAQFRLVKTK